MGTERLNVLESGIRINLLVINIILDDRVFVMMPSIDHENFVPTFLNDRNMPIIRCAIFLRPWIVNEIKYPKL